MNIQSKAIIVSLLMCCAYTSPQAEELPSRGPIPFAVYDKDDNGTISETEFNSVRGERMSQRAAEGRPMRNAGKGPAFSDFDSNGDGQLSQEELTAGQQKQMGARGGMRPSGGMGQGRNMPAFSDYDLDGNGVIAEQEFYEARSKRISERAQQGFPMRNIGNAPAFGDIDSNKDGYINGEEFSAHQQQHRRMPKQ